MTWEVAQSVCEKFDPEFYPKFKAWADDYFYCKHRGQRRGLGGIFFDDLNDRPKDQVALLLPYSIGMCRVCEEELVLEAGLLKSRCLVC